jgi:hypothetical protein
MSSRNNDVDVETLAETENYMIWMSNEPDDELVYHLELGAITLHFFIEEWREVMQLFRSAREADPKP